MTTEVKVKERPILFSGDMVRAILEGRKTQTRRIVNPQPNHMPILAEAGLTFGADPEKDGSEWLDADCIHGGIPIIPKYGVPGERLWVKETFKVNGTMAGPRVTYRADDKEIYPKGCPDDCPDWVADDNNWRPSIFMRRYASRITLEIESVRIERLKDISEEDAKAEGAHRKIWITSPFSAGALNATAERGTHREGYKDIWESINWTGSWELNPWVWAITFRRTNQ